MKKLRKFAGMDFYAYQGMRDFPDGSKPMIVNGKNVTLLIGGFDSTDAFGIELIFHLNIYNIVEAFKVYDNIERAQNDALLLAQTLDIGHLLSKEFLSDFGFEVIF